MAEKTIFRQSAITAYRRSLEKDTLPHVISWPIILGLWCLLGILLATLAFAWYVQVPTYVGGTGIILAQGDTLQPETVAVVFLPPNQSAQVRTGLPVNLQIGSTGIDMQGTISQVEGIMSPATVQQRYQLEGAGSLLITQPSVVVSVKLDTELPIATYAGSILTAKVEVGSQRLLTLLFGSGQFLESSS